MKNLVFLISLFTIIFLSSPDYAQKQRIKDILKKKNITSKHSLETLFKNHQSHIQVNGKGTVIKILPDDLKGSKHQRFIIRYSPSLTLLIVHNIDISPRLNNIKIGDEVEFFGEYIWNKKGGLIHWTHRDPNKKHIDGYLKFKGKKYN